MALIKTLTILTLLFWEILSKEFPFYFEFFLKVSILIYQKINILAKAIYICKLNFKQMKKPFNTYTNRNGQTLPKSATIPSSPEILNWLKENFYFAWANAGKLIDESKPYIVIGISASHQGYIYCHISTCDEREISMYHPNMIKDFTDEEAFKKYLNWARKFPKKLVNTKFI